MTDLLTEELVAHSYIIEKNDDWTDALVAFKSATGCQPGAVVMNSNPSHFINVSSMNVKFDSMLHPDVYVIQSYVKGPVSERFVAWHDYEGMQRIAAYDLPSMHEVQKKKAEVAQAARKAAADAAREATAASVAVLDSITNGAITSGISKSTITNADMRAVRVEGLPDEVRAMIVRDWLLEQREKEVRLPYVVVLEELVRELPTTQGNAPGSSGV